jgi:beta-xylosidase
MKLSYVAMGLVLAAMPCSMMAKGNKTYANPVINQSAPDPTVIRAADGHFYLYATENVPNTPIFRSDNLVDWELIGTAFTPETRPQWNPKGHLWAPDINMIDGKYVLYYAKSEWGGEWTCGVGVATADKPEGPFTDHGAVLISNQIGVQNSIDPFYIEEDGHKYLFWGSFRGIYGIELSADGLSILPGAEKVQIAGNFMEGTYIHKHDGYYYLFGSAGSCCEGERSTYRVTVGRSKNLFGPYVDKNGDSLLDDHYEVILSRSETVIGPGHNSEIITDKKGNDWMLYHGFSAAEPKRGRLVYMDRVEWRNGWPYFANGQPSETSPAPKL